MKLIKLPPGEPKGSATERARWRPPPPAPYGRTKKFEWQPVFDVERHIKGIKG